MTEHPAPVLVYNRIEENRRNTVALLALVPLLLLPFAAGIVVYLVPWLLFYGPLPQRSALEDPLRFELLATISAATIVLGVTTIATLLTAWLYRSAMLRATGAKPLPREEESDLWRTVENLCIGAGLPQPRLYVVDSAVPNAFATGPDPAHACLGITRGLLALLQHRELEGVIAHELSHIGNQDTRLSTAVAAALVTLRLPIGIVTGTYRFLATMQLGLGIIFLLGFFGFFGLMSTMSVVSIGFFSSGEVPRWMLWRQVFVAVAPYYVLFAAPAIGLLIRQAISGQREFLADADAVVLTRDPEGLALALTKIGAWSGPKTLNVGLSAAHFCIVDPLPAGTPWWDKVFPCHPSIEDRVDLLVRMGSGVSASALQAAKDAGAEAAERESVNEMIAEARIEKETAALNDVRENESDQPADTDRATTPLFEQPDGWSAVLRELPDGAELTFGATTGEFVRVTTADNLVGYIAESARKRF